MNKERFDEIVEKFKTTRDLDGDILNMHYLLIKQNQEVYLHRFNDRQELSDVRSLSKTVMTIVTGIIIEKSKENKYPHFDEETYIYPILSKVIHLSNSKNLEKLQKVKVKHLLNHTVGYNQVLLMRNDVADRDPFTYLDYLINEPLMHEAGDYYLYSNAGFYLLSVVLQEFINEDLLGFFERNLFQELEIEDYRWEKYGNYLAGATRLWMNALDLLKIGELLLGKGLYQGKRLVSKEWIDKILIPTTYTSNVDSPKRTFRRYAYGSGIWLAIESIFFGHGTDGQTLIMVPDKNSIILTLAHQKEIIQLENILNSIIEKDL